VLMVCTLVCERSLHVEIRPLRTSPQMVDSSKCTRPPCRELAHAYNHAADGLAMSTSPPTILPRMRSPEIPQNRPYDRTVSATGSCFGNLTLAGETVTLMHPAPLGACLIGVSAFRRFEVPRHLRASNPLFNALRSALCRTSASRIFHCETRIIHFRPVSR